MIRNHEVPVKSGFPIAPVLAVIACAAIGGVFAEPSVPPARTTRPIVRVIPAYSPDGQPVPPPAPSPAPVMIPGHPAPPPVGPPLAAGLLAWDAEGKEETVTFGAAQADFHFQVTNVSQEPVTVISVNTSCGCTVAKLAPMPWKIAPGGKGTIDVAMNLAGKQGVNLKNVTVNTDRGFKILSVTTKIQEPPAGAMNEADRARNLQIATANRQAVLHGECASCHSTPAINKTGAELYQAACTICHEAEHRAASVPDLKQLKKETTADYWRTWITSSAQGKLMPAFAIDHGGILNSVQIDSLVKYLMDAIPSEKPHAPPPTPVR